MHRSSRLFEIIQILRNQVRPITADQIAGMLEVSTRTIYRDIATLQSMRTPIDGEAGIGYLMRSGYDLPPLNFGPDEIEAIVVGLSLLSRTGDEGLKKAAKRVSEKIDGVRENIQSLHVSDWGVDKLSTVDMGELRRSIRENQKIEIKYIDESSKESARIILPIAIIYYTEVIVLVAWCQLREDFRHFRVDRILSSHSLDEYFGDIAINLREVWRNTQQE